MKKLVGFNYLHRHPQMENDNDISANHVIVDRKDWEEVVNYFHIHPEEVVKIKTFNKEKSKD